MTPTHIFCRKLFTPAVTILLFAFLLSGCSSGPLDVTETYYLKVTNGEDSGYIRIQVEAHTDLSDAEYRSGWYPTDAVDAAFGKVSDDPTGKTRAAQEAMRDQLVAALKKAQEEYLKVVLNKNSTREEMEQALKRWKDTRKAPGFVDPSNPDVILVEYNPGEGIETARAGEKLIFLLSANPDEVIDAIKTFASSNDTKAEIQRLSSMIVKNAEADLNSRKARSSVAAQADQLLASSAEQVAQSLEAGTKPTRDAAVGELQSLQALLMSLQNSGGQP